MKKDIAFTIQNFVQFYSLKNGIDELIKKNYSVDIYIPISTDKTGYGDLYNETYNELVKLNYSIKRETDENTSYTLLLEPYPMDSFFRISYKYRIKYKYSLLSAKPNLVYKPESNLEYDTILCFSTYDAQFLNVFAKTELIGNLKYLNFKRMPMKAENKKVLLYLPTYGEESSIDSIIEELKKLKNDFYIITKLHHGTSYLKNEKNKIKELENISDECFDHTIELVELLSKADVVLSDNSGAIFETIYANVPLAIYSKDINKNKLGSFDTIQYRLVKDGYIPYTNNASKIKEKLEEAISEQYIQKQKKLSNDLFYRPQEPINDFVKKIEKFINDDIDLNYKSIHDELIKDCKGKEKAIIDLQQIIQANNISKIELENIINEKDKKIDELDGIVGEKNLNIKNLEEKINQQNIKEESLIIKEKKLKNILEEKQKEIQELNQANIFNEKENKRLVEEIDKKDIIIEYYQKGKLYRLSKKIYELYYKLIGKK